jgi:Fe-S oxidoreductase
MERFKSLGIRRIIVPCSGCHKCFKYFYPELLGETSFSVHHVVEVIYDRLKEDRHLLNKVQRTVTYQDPCRLARGEGITEEPREILHWCGAQVKEVERNRKEAFCCGAGAGIRSVYRDLSLQIASKLLDTVETESIVSTCPFCTFNLNLASREKGLTKSVTYFANVVLDSLK